MSNDKTKEPLLSDEVLSKLNCRCENCVRRVSAVMEASCQQDKDRIDELTGLVQELVDAAAKSDSIMLDMAERGYYPHAALQDNGGDGLGFNTSALSKAKQSGFTPNT